MHSNKPIFFPGLNGLRALAALSVVIFHLTRDFDMFGLDPYIMGRLADGSPKGFAMAGFGVTIFFALSGFLITYLLLSEKQQQEIDIKKFYVRRILRIWPLYYLYLAAALIVIYVYSMPMDGNMLLTYIFFSANVPHILNTPLPFLRHYWSLGVEEQYYLFWPWVVKKIKHRLVAFVIGFIMVFVLLKCSLHFLRPGTILEAFLDATRFDCMLIGSLGAILYFNKQELFIKLFTSKITQAISWFVVVLLVMNIFHIASIIDHEIVSVVTVALIMGQITVKNRLVNLDIKPCDFLGKISYGIYVIHPLVIFFSAKLLKDIQMPPILKYAFVYCFVTAVTILVSWLSYNYIEKWFLTLKSKYMVVKSANVRTA